MKIKSLMYVLMGTMLITTSCSDNELEKGNGSGTVDPVNASALVNVYSDKSGSEASLLVGNVFVKDSRTLTLNVPVACEKVYMKYNTVSGTEATKEFALSPVSRSAGQGVGFNFETNRLASVTLALPEDAVQPTNETDQGYLFYHNTGVVMFEDGWPTQLALWYDEDFNDVVFEYDLKVTECHSQQMMETVGGKEELLLTLDVRAIGGIYPTVLGVVLDGLKSEYVDRITASLVLKGGQGTMTDLAKEELSTKDVVKIENKNWNWNNDTRTEPRFAILTVDKAQTEGTVITLDGLSSLKDNNQDMFQVTPGKVREGLPMLRAEIRLIGKEGLTGADRDAQLAAFRGLILDTNRQNFFIKVSSGKEIHMKGYKPTSAYKAEYDELVANDATLDKAVYYSNTNGSTWGVKMPVGARHAYETVPFKVAYTGFADWVNTNGASNKNWYENFDAGKTVRYW
ncbi:MAG: DUF4842 domain-containing protein [Bacteroides sp.]|nr:DUF4842 domain-containing protein [Bacteroides sp.]